MDANGRRKMWGPIVPIVGRSADCRTRYRVIEPCLCTIRLDMVTLDQKAKGTALGLNSWAEQHAHALPVSGMYDYAARRSRMGYCEYGILEELEDERRCESVHWSACLAG